MPVDFNGGAQPRRRNTGPQRVLNEGGRPDFTLKHHPARWQEIAGELLPVLSTMSHRPGVNNVDHYGDTTRAEVDAQREGWTLIPLSACPGHMTPDGQDGYVRVYRGHGAIHVTAWEKPRTLGNRVVWDRDEEGYREWLRHLMREGVVGAPDPVVVEILREQLIQKRDRKAVSADVNPYAREAVGHIDVALERLAAAERKLYGEPEPAKPARKRGKA
jgi:hypothetical protein